MNQGHTNAATDQATTRACEYAVAEYENGWVVERPRDGSATEACDFVTVKGPFRHKENAVEWLRILSGQAA